MSKSHPATPGYLPDRRHATTCTDVLVVPVSIQSCRQDQQKGSLWGKEVRFPPSAPTGTPHMFHFSAPRPQIRENTPWKLGISASKGWLLSSAVCMLHTPSSCCRLKRWVGALCASRAPPPQRAKNTNTCRLETQPPPPPPLHRFCPDLHASRWLHLSWASRVRISVVFYFLALNVSKLFCEQSSSQA